ncbi:MAG TPA: hypothetical protein VI976_04580 [Candidatus Omnitrophota bacterium]|nr:hypothetical protein [Candidatus Omnitrophota bacterium]
MREKKVFYFIIAAIAWFLFLSLLHYFSQRPLWLDERLVFNNIRELSIQRLFGPLEYYQIFPRVYLAGIKIFSQYFNFSMLSLRFLPLVFMVLSFFIWLKIYRLEAETDFQFALMLGLLSTSYYITYYAAELKQYSADLFAISVFTIFIYYQRRFLEGACGFRPLLIFSILSPFLIFLSYISVLMPCIIAYNYLFLLRRGIKVWFVFILFLALSCLSVFLIYQADIKFSMLDKRMYAFWNDYFISTDSIGNFFKSLSEGMRNLTVRWFLETKFARNIATAFMPFCWLAIFRYSYSSLVKFKGKILDINSLCLILILELFVLGVLKFYPFTGERVTLFIAPFIFYMIIKGIYLVKDIKAVFYPLLGIYAVLVSIACVYSLSSYARLYLDRQRYARLEVKEAKEEAPIILYQSKDKINFNALSGPGKLKGSGPSILRVEF